MSSARYLFRFCGNTDALGTSCINTARRKFYLLGQGSKGPAPFLPTYYQLREEVSLRAVPWYPQVRFLAGHNKWSKIKRKKGAKDTARAAAHGKAALAIRAASLACGGDLDNLHLQSTISAAKALQLPKDRITDAIEKGANPTAGDGELFNMRYDGMLSTQGGKVACIVTALTDNKNRTAANVRSYFVKNGGELLSTGSNDWLFEHVGVALVPKKKKIMNDDGIAEREEVVEEEDLLEVALEGGATNVDFGEENDEHAFVTCIPSDLLSLVSLLQEANLDPIEFENRWMLKDDANGIELGNESIEKLEKFLDKVDHDIDVTGVFHNASIDSSNS